MLKTYEYIPENVCSKRMVFIIDNNIIKDIKVEKGCSGNSLGIKNLCIGKNIDLVINKLKGIKCGLKNTSCPDQIAIALEEYKKNPQN